MATLTSLQPAYILKAIPYRDSSLLLDVFTKHHGRISLVARGARSARSRFQGLLQPFLSLLIAWRGKTELCTLSAAESDRSPLSLKGNLLICGWYLNELIFRTLHRFDSHPALFDAYQYSLEHLAEHPQLKLRSFEKKLLTELGFAPSLDRETQTGRAIQAEQWYYINQDRGLEACLPQSHRLGEKFQGSVLLALHQERFHSLEELQSAKRFLRLLLDQLLNGVVMRSRELWS